MNELYIYSAIILWGYLRYYHFRRNDENKEYSPNDIPEFTLCDNIIASKIPYYRNLSSEGKQIFISRVMMIKDEIDIRGETGFQITEEVKVLVSACITQLTYGFEDPRIPFLNGIAVYPDIFYSKLARAWVKGLALGNGAVFLSWKYFIEGYYDTADTINLGLHEFTHILYFQSGEQSGFDDRLSAYYEEWERVGYPVFMRVKEGSEKFLRSYAGANKVEFFSVCVENFFEVPQLFEQKLPELYYHLCYLLKQNPLNRSADYTFNTSDAKEINEELTDDVPVYDVVYSGRERQFYDIIGKFAALFLGISVYCFANMQTYAQFETLRIILLSLLIFAGMRWFYYKSHKSILNPYYIIHLATKLVPLLATTLTVYEFTIR